MKKATRQHTKQHNSRLILKKIYDEDMISRADIARATHLTRATVSSIVADLMDERLVVEAGLGPSVGGKPPRLLSFAENARQMLCLDLSTQCFRGALVNLRGEIQYQTTIPVNGRVGLEALTIIYQLIDQLFEHSDADVLGLGIGTPGLVDTAQGIIKDAVNLGWHDVPLQTLLAERYDNLPVYIANDSHLAALAAYSFGPHETNNLVLIKAGQGIGAGVVLNGQLHYGEGFGAGEIGHVTVVEQGYVCTCGNYGCLETVASTRGILRQAETLLTEPVTWEAVVTAAQRGDTAVTQLVREAGQYLGTAVAYLIGILNVKSIVIAGEITQLGAELLTATRITVTQRVLPSMAADTDIRFTALDKDIVLLGASALVLKYQLGLI